MKIYKKGEYMKFIHLVGIICFLVGLDLGTKWYQETNLKLGQSVPVIPEWLSWKLIHNPGVSFGLFSGYTPILISVQFILVIVIIFAYKNFEPKSFYMQIGFALLISGAIGNLVDRIRFGYVIDFISFRWWPAIFNIADMEIRTGVLLLVILYLFREKFFGNECLKQK
jgi:signal peptidase II